MFGENKMKIAIFTDSFLPGVGGTENAVLNYAAELSKTEEVIVFAPDYHREWNTDNLNFKVVRCKSLPLSKNEYLAEPKKDKAFINEIDKFSPEVIHCETLAPLASFAARYAKKKKIPLVYTAHTKYRFCYINTLKSKLLAEMVVKTLAKPMKLADEVTAVSEDMAREIHSYGIDKPITVIKNGGERRNNVCERKINDRINFLFVGLVIKYKNIGFILSALSVAKKKGLDFIFNVVGSGPDEKYFKKKADRLGLSENVVFHGRITDHKKLDAVYAANDLFLFPSVFDNDPLVVCEAGNMGTPSLVLKNTGASERITDGVNGFLSENDVNAYADKIISLSADKARLTEVGENAKNLFSEWKENVKEYRKLYQRLINKE